MKRKMLWAVLWVAAIGAILFGDTVYKLFQPEQTAAVKETASIAEEPISPVEIPEEETLPVSQEEITPNKAGEAAAFIASYHDSLNNLTGFGNINHPNWETVRSTAAQMVLSLAAMQYEGDLQLQQDFESIHNLAKRLESENDTQSLIQLHRYLHDLDVVMNNDNGTGDYFGVTAWGELNK